MCFGTLLITPVAESLAQSDPHQLLPPSRPSFGANVTCDDGAPILGALSLPRLVDLALCRNPATASAWASARTTAAQAGEQRALINRRVL
jgi:outer membrane protein